MDQPTTLQANQAQFVTLGIDQEVFGVPVDSVVEIIDVRAIFRLPDAPAYMLGLIDVRERPVPVIDLRRKLGFPGRDSTENTRILVMEIPLGGRPLVLGLVADRVFEVTGLDGAELDASPDIGVDWRSDYIRGIGRRAGGFVVILDLAKLFTADEIRRIDTGLHTARATEPA